jgi:hypothetical protein
MDKQNVMATNAALVRLLADGGNTIIKGWLLALQRTGDARISTQEIESQARDLLRASRGRFRPAEVSDVEGPAFQEVRDILEGFSRTRALQGLSSSETATFVFSMKEPLFEKIRAEAKNADTVAEQAWALTLLLDKLGLFTIEVHHRTREELIARLRFDFLSGNARIAGSLQSQQPTFDDGIPSVGQQTYQGRIGRHHILFVHGASSCAVPLLHQVDDSGTPRAEGGFLAVALVEG